MCGMYSKSCIRLCIYFHYFHGVTVTVTINFFFLICLSNYYLFSIEAIIDYKMYEQAIGEST